MTGPYKEYETGHSDECGIEFGSKVRITARYHRETTRTPGGYKQKEYIAKPTDAVGVYLGRRTITNGKTECDEDGIYWSPDKWFQVGLVCLKQNDNPIYVPLGAVKEL